MIAFGEWLSVSIILHKIFAIDTLVLTPLYQ